MALARYALVGGTATGVHYGTLLVLVEGLRVAPPLSSTIGALFGAFVAYAGNRRFTFQRQSDHRRALPRFLVVAAFGAALNGGVVWAGTDVFALHYFVAQGLATVIALFITYEINRAWTFI